MYLSFGKINIEFKNVVIGVVALILSLFLAYYLASDENENENDDKLENLGDYFNYLYNKVYFIYVLVFMTIVFYNILHFLFLNRDFIKREINSRGRALYNKTLGPNFINSSIRGGVDATNKLYDYSGRAYNYLIPNRARVNPGFTVEPLYMPKKYNPFD
jgi:uncharacterized membrane protein